MQFSRFPLLLLTISLGLPAKEFTALIVDGLNRPVANVRVDLSCFSNGQMSVVHLQSADDGTVHGTYDDAASCRVVSLEKPGYASYTTGVRPRYVLFRTFDAEDLLRIVKLEGDKQRQELREALAGRANQSRFNDLVFYHEGRLRPVMRALARDPEITGQVRNLLSMIGVAQDLHLIMQLAPPPATPVFPHRWRYAVVTALVNPDNEDEWSFLRDCAVDEFKDRWVDAGAIQTLKLTGSPRSRTILEEAQQKNRTRASEIAQALDYINSNPAPMAESSLEALAERVAKVLSPGRWQDNSAPRLNQAGDKALIDFKFETPTDLFVYTATFHKTGGAWTLRGVHETSQAVRAAPVRPKEAHSFPEGP